MTHFATATTLAATGGFLNGVGNYFTGNSTGIGQYIKGSGSSASQGTTAIDDAEFEDG